MSAKRLAAAAARGRVRCCAAARRVSGIERRRAVWHRTPHASAGINNHVACDARRCKGFRVCIDPREWPG